MYKAITRKSINPNPATKRFIYDSFMAKRELQRQPFSDEMRLFLNYLLDTESDRFATKSDIEKWAKLLVEYHLLGEAV